MGQYITIKDSLVITLFSMLVVFAGLILISLIIGLLKNVSGGKEEEKKKQVKPKEVKKAATVVKEEDDEELVAVIAAAVAASLGVGIGDITIRNIRRLDPNTNPWDRAGLSEQMNSRL